MEIYKDLSNQASQEFEKLLNSQLSKINIEWGKWSIYRVFIINFPLACVDTAAIIHNGKVIAQGTPSNLIQNIDARNAYFGDSFKIS